MPEIRNFVDLNQERLTWETWPYATSPSMYADSRIVGQPLAKVKWKGRTPNDPPFRLFLKASSHTNQKHVPRPTANLRVLCISYLCAVAELISKPIRALRLLVIKRDRLDIERRQRC